MKEERLVQVRVSFQIEDRNLYCWFLHCLEMYSKCLQLGMGIVVKRTNIIQALLKLFLFGDLSLQ